VLVILVGDAPADAPARLREATSYDDIDVVAAPAVTAEVNAAVRGHAGEVVAFLDAGLEPQDPAWLRALLEYAQQPAIGAAGGRIRYPDGRVRHIGLILGAGTGVARAMHLHLGPYGYFSSIIGARNYSAVSGECLMTRREVFDAAGGFDNALPWNAADVDYCLNVRRAGLRVVYTPSAELRIHGAARPEPAAEAIAVLAARWAPAFEADPYYNPNLSVATADYRLGERR
jgi:hypothetical protein